MGKHAHVSRRAADVHDHGVLLVRQKRCAADGVRRPAGDREDGIALRVVNGHERAVVLPQVHRHVGKPFGSKRGLEAVGGRVRDVVQCRVQDGCVLALQETERADLARKRDGELIAQLSGKDLGGATLVGVRHRGEHARYRHGFVPLFAHGARHVAQLVFGKRADLATVELVAAVHQEISHAHGVFELLRPIGHAADGRGRRRADAQRRHLVQALALHDRVGAMRRAEHSEPDVRRRLGADLRQHLVHGRLNAAHHVLGRRAFRGGDQLQVAVDDDGIGVGASDVDPQPPGTVRISHYACAPSACWAASSSTGT